MRFILALVVLVTGIAFAFTARAADVRPQSLKPAAVEVTISNDHNPFAGAYLGAELGGQFTGIRDNGEDIAAVDGLTYGLNGGYNFSAGRFIFGPYVKGGFGRGTLEYRGTEILSMDNYVQIGGLVGVQLGKESLLSGRIGYEWQNWEGLKRYDIDAGGLAIGGSLETMIAPQTSLGVNVDYVTLSDIEVEGLGDVSKYVDDTDAFRVTVGVTYRPQVNLPNLF